MAKKDWKEYKTGSMNDDETAVYTKAFRESKGSHVKGRSRDAAEAVKNYRDGLDKAVSKGIKEGTIRDRVKKRMKKID